MQHGRQRPNGEAVQGSDLRFNGPAGGEGQNSAEATKEGQGEGCEQINQWRLDQPGTNKHGFGTATAGMQNDPTSTCQTHSRCSNEHRSRFPRKHCRRTGTVLENPMKKTSRKLIGIIENPGQIFPTARNCWNTTWQQRITLN